MNNFFLLFIFLSFPTFFLCITFKQSTDKIEDEVLVVVEKYFTNELTLGLYYDSDENLLSVKTHLPVNIYNHFSSTNCNNIGRQSDGFIFLTSNITNYNTKFIDFVECVSKSMRNYKQKKFLIIDVVHFNQNSNNNRYVFFQHLWMKFGMIHIIILPVVQQSSGFEFRHILAYNPFLPGKDDGPGELLVFDVHEFDASLQNRFTIMHGYALNVTMLPFGFNVQKDLINRSDSIQGGPDLMMKRTIESHLNVTLVPRRPRDNQLFSSIINGKATGPLADVIDNVVEYAVNTGGYRWFNTSYVQWLQPAQFDSVIVIIKKKPPLETWIIFWSVFQYQVWFGILVTTIVVCALYVVFEKTHSIIYFESPRAELTSVVFSALKSLLSLAVNHVPYPTSGRILMTSCLLLSIIIVNLFSGQIYTFIKSKPRPAQVDKLQHLLGYNIITQHQGLVNIFDNFDNSSLSELKHRISHKNNSENFLSDLSDREAYLDSRLYMLSIFNGSIPDDFHVLKETVYHYYLGYKMPVGSIYYDQFNLMILKVFQFGLYDKWIQESMMYSRTHTFYNELGKVGKTASKSHKHALKYKDLKLPFYVFYAGLFISVICFLGEIITHKFMCR